MQKAKITLDKSYVIGKIDPRMFGSFIEHLGRAVYGGIYEPDHETADDLGFRKDVLSLVRKLNVPVVRYPGGNFVSGFNWEDSVGPREKRNKRLDLAWFTTETNEVGLHEFYDWCQRANSSLMYCVNLGTRGPENARDIVEYCNHPGGSKYSDMRISNGRKDPFSVKLWCLGNEMDGPWQMGHKTAYEYGRIANESAKLMRWVDPSIELVACGSSKRVMPTFGEWELTMLDECYENIDYVSLHRYYENPTNDVPGFLARTMDLDDFIKTVVCICDSIKGKKNSKKQVNLSFDEWNVWYHSKKQDEEVWKRDKWGRALPLLEDVYNFEDALLMGCILITFLKNADRVKIACLAQLVNVIAPIMTANGGPCWEQTTFYPFMHVSNYGRGVALQTLVDSPVYDCADYENVPYICAMATMDEANESVTVFCVNRHMHEDFCLDLDMRAFGKMQMESHILLKHSDVKVTNTRGNPNNVMPVEVPVRATAGEKASVQIPALSWNVLRFRMCK